ncbi:hypothetical protein B0H16DRAFT_1425229 [Mycena metata]|uniref:Uncharacterized protein n=1 Tax=Mycena metata TaxID=1033252 RepID=A0AAD7I9Y6_9AGAR|nr:hypothetical protein B0H16DRAFT_1425229 [Mycena metata]
MTLDLPDADPPPVYDSRTMTDSKKEDGATTSGPQPRYIYYRVYAPDGAIPSKSAFDSSNPFVGRIAARSVPPPHNVTSLKGCFVKTENFNDPTGLRTVLYLNPAAQAPMQNSARVAILGAGSTPGSTPETVFALVFIEELTMAEKVAVGELEVGENRGHNPEYLYYHLFTQFGEDTSTVSFDLGEPALGRIKKIDICPPHTPATIKRCIARAERKPICAYAAQLYADISSDMAMADDFFISLFRDDCVGSTADKPMVLVQPERRVGLYNVPIKVIAVEKHVCLYITVSVRSPLIASAMSRVDSSPRLAQSFTQTARKDM